VFCDIASGSRAARPELAAALDYLRPGDQLVVWRLDRLGRNVGHLISTLDGLHARGVEFFSLQEGMDTATPAGRMLYVVLGALAEFERAVLIERVQAGLAAARAAGRTGGRPRALDEHGLAAVRSLKASGTTIRAIARTLGVGSSTVYRALARTAVSPCEGGGNDVLR